MMSAKSCWSRGFSWLAEVKSKSMCLGSDRIHPGSHSQISRNQVGVPKLYMLLAKSLISDPMDCSPPRLLCPWNPPGKSTGVGCHCLLRIVIAVALNDSWLPPLPGFWDCFLTFPQCLVKGAVRYLKRSCCREITLHCCFLNVKNQNTTNQISQASLLEAERAQKQGPDFLHCPVWGPHTPMSSSILPNWAQPQVPIHRVVNKHVAVTLSN